jgi:predicted nucleotidyltransferase
MGSAAYGIQQEASDLDIYGWCIPPKHLVFPHLSGEIPGFGRQIERFQQWSEHHIEDKSAKKEYDFSVYSIVKYFQLVMENNPNMIDSLFVPRSCILHITPLGEIMRENRKLFLHKGSWHKFKGYAYSQMHKIRNKVNASNPERNANIEKYGYDIKFAYHTIRLMNEVEQILVEGDLDLQRNKEQLKDIRRGEWTLDQIEKYFESKEKILEETYANSKLRHSPDEQEIKKILLFILESHYGSVSDFVKIDVSTNQLLTEMQSVIDRYRK